MAETLLGNPIASRQDIDAFLHSLQIFNYFAVIEPKGKVCHIYTPEEVMDWNFKVWATTFVVLGLNFTHLDVGPLKHFTLSPSRMKRWRLGMWILWIVVMIIVVGAFVNLCFVLYDSGMLLSYIIVLILLAGTVSILTWNYSQQGYELHIHHYCFGFVFAALSGYQDIIISASQAFCTAIYIEGGCRWGYDPIWPKPWHHRKYQHPPDSDDEDAGKSKDAS